MSTSIVYLLVALLLLLPWWGVCQSGSSSGDSEEQLESCPSLAGGLPTFTPQLDTYIEDTSSLVMLDVITNGTQLWSSLPLSPVSTTLTLHLLSHETRPLHSAVSVWTGDKAVAPSGCTSPTQAQLLPTVDTEVNLMFACSGVGSVTMRVCVTVGTEFFNILNGSYITYTLHINRECPGPSQASCEVRDMEEAVAVEFCATRNQTRQLVLSGAGSWGALLTSFNTENEESGFCLVSEFRRGVNTIFSTEAITRLFAVPEAFPAIDGYFEATNQEAFSFHFDVVVENSSVLSPVEFSPSIPTNGSYIGRLETSFVLPCINEGITRVTYRLNSSSFIDGILYRRDYEPFFFRNCTKDPNSTIVVVIELDHNLGLTVGLPVALIIVVIITIVVVTAAIIVYYTQRYKRKSLMLEQVSELDNMMSFSNAYVKSNFEEPFNFLKQYNMEYNYALLEPVDNIGEGAFGRVFKARAPGISRGEYTPKEFVAVKTLKQDSETDLSEDFRAEVKVCVQFEHHNVIRLIGVCTETTQKCMIFEYMDVGGLDSLLRTSDPLAPDYDTSGLHLMPEQFLPTAIQVANGLDYLAGLKFVHRDVASRNCLVDRNLTVKIADFGLSRKTNAMDYYRIGSTNACLPVRWMPPESLLYGKFTVKSDVWSFGVLVWEIYTFGHQPYSGLSNHEVIDKIKTGGCLDCPPLCAAPVYNTLKMTWTRAPSRRPTIRAVVEQLVSLIAGVAGEEGYHNMTFGTLPSKEEMEVAKKVADDLDVKNAADLEAAKKIVEEMEAEEAL